MTFVKIYAMYIKLIGMEPGRAQSERKSTSRYGDEFFEIINFYMLLFAKY